MGGDHLVPHRIRTVALLGQGGAGKTALGEGLLTAAGAASRGGVLDSAEERERGHSLSLSTELRALTHGAGTVSMAFDHYDVAPDHVAA